MFIINKMEKIDQPNQECAFAFITALEKHVGDKDLAKLLNKTLANPSVITGLAKKKGANSAFIRVEKESLNEVLGEVAQIKHRGRKLRVRETNISHTKGLFFKKINDILEEAKEAVE